MIDMRAALEESEIPPISRGSVWLVSDAHLRLTPDTPRTPPKKRPVIVLGQPDLLQDHAFPFVWGVPCTTTPRGTGGALEVPVPQAERAFNRASSAIVYLLQPVKKHALKEPLGTISDAFTEELFAHIAVMLDMRDAAT